MYKRQVWDSAKEARFIGPGFEHIQPREAATANNMAIKDRTTTRSQIIREQGREPSEVFAEAAEEEEDLRELGLATMLDDPPDDEPANGDDADENDGETNDGDEDAEGNLKKNAARPLANNPALRDAIRQARARGASLRQLEKTFRVGHSTIGTMLSGHLHKQDN